MAAFAINLQTANIRPFFEQNSGRYAIQGSGMCAVMPMFQPPPIYSSFTRERSTALAPLPVKPASRRTLRPSSRPRKNIAILVHDGVELLDFAGPGGLLLGRSGACLQHLHRFCFLRADHEPRFPLGHPSLYLRRLPQARHPHHPRARRRSRPATRRSSIGFGRSPRMPKLSSRFAPGLLLLAKAGLLDGLEATTHHNSLERLKEAAPKTRVLEGRRCMSTMARSLRAQPGLGGHRRLAPRSWAASSALTRRATRQRRWSIAGSLSCGRTGVRDASNTYALHACTRKTSSV